MGSLCFSSASILRCESFTSLESQLLIIPTALELIFSTTLVITNWGTGWRHLLLTAEGWSYFALALLELLSHNLPAVRDSVSVFSIVDIVLGATSFLPIFFYTLFVYLFTRGELIDTLPKRFQRIANVLLVFFIPAVVALNELSSFVGISRGTIISNGRPVVGIGFNTSSDQQLWTFFTSLTLALLTAFEAINFCFAFYRLIRAFVDQRRIETTSSDSAHLIRGIGWITGGFKLGAIETVVGFAQGGFGGAFTRRIIRFLARAFLIIGIVKGVDQVDDFAEVAQDLAAGRGNNFRRSRLGMLISNPRFSTFRQLSPTAKEFYNAPRGGAGEKSSENPPAPQMSEFAQLRRAVTQTQPASPIYTLAGPMSQQQRQLTTPPKPVLQRSLTTQTTASAAARQRVTVQYTEGAPTLHMRFSGLEMPSPAVIAESVKARPISQSWVSIARESRYAPSIAPSFAFDPIPPKTAKDAPPLPNAGGITYPEFIYERNKAAPSTLGDGEADDSSYYPPQQPQIQDKGKAPAHKRGISEYSTRSSLSVGAVTVRELAAQFPVPGIPPTQRPAPRAGPSPIPESPYQGEYDQRRSWDAERGYPQRNLMPSSPDPPPMQYTYGGMEYPATPQPADDEPVYSYAYDGPVSPPAREQNQRIPHPYAAGYNTGYNPYSPPRVNEGYSPPSDSSNNSNNNNGYSNAYSTVYSPPTNRQRNDQTGHRNGKSDTTMGTTPQTYMSSRFDDGESRAETTPNTEADAESDPFQFDALKQSRNSRTRSRSQEEYREEQEDFEFPAEGQGVPEEVYMGDGPHSYQHQHNASVATRTSAALLQMTQRGNVDWAPAGVEFTPSVFSASTTPSSAHGRNTLKKKRRPSKSRSGKSDVPESVGGDTIVSSSWLRGDMRDDDIDMYADDEGVIPSMSMPAAGGPGRVKSVGRVRAPTKSTPAPVVPTRHGLTRGSIYIQPITVPPAVYNTEVQIVQGGSSADSYNSEFAV